jgi:hypothetical protein
VTYEEFLRQLGKAGLTVKEFARLVRMNRVSISNNAKKKQVPSHLAVIACLMGEMAEQSINYREALSRIEIEPKKARGAAARGRFGGDRQTDMFATAGFDPPGGRAGQKRRNKIRT